MGKRRNSISPEEHKALIGQSRRILRSLYLIVDHVERSYGRKSKIAVAARRAKKSMERRIALQAELAQCEAAPIENPPPQSHADLFSYDGHVDMGAFLKETEKTLCWQENAYRKAYYNDTCRRLDVGVSLWSLRHHLAHNLVDAWFHFRLKADLEQVYYDAGQFIIRDE